MPPSRPPHLVLCPSPEEQPDPVALREVPPHSLVGAYSKYAAYVAYIGIRILGRNDEIDDLVQDVFVEGLRGLGTLRDPAAVKAWLSTVTVRVATRKLRIRKIKRVLRQDPLDHDVSWPGASPEESAAICQVYRKLERVPAKHRAAWVLRVVEQEPLDQVAKVCGCSLATVKRWVCEVQAVVTGEPKESER